MVDEAGAAIGRHFITKHLIGKPKTFNFYFNEISIMFSSAPDSIGSCHYLNIQTQQSCIGYHWSLFRARTGPLQRVCCARASVHRILNSIFGEHQTFFKPNIPGGPKMETVKILQLLGRRETSSSYGRLKADGQTSPCCVSCKIQAV